jgi:murein DD-endopeptidase MepM/ murein hydrolase activator NlpD
MAERLPFGQVNPVAKPLDTYIQPSAQNSLAKPAQPSEIQVTGGLRAIGTSGGGVIRSQADPGRNLQATAEALAPFNRALTTTLTAGVGMLKAQQIDAGYIEAQNEYARAQLVMQQQAEVSATNAASQITQLEKVDPVAAILLKDANPWKQIGRRRAIAQIAGADLDGALSTTLSQDFGRLAGLPPGSGELMKARVKVTDQVMQRYGLTEDMPEVAQYFTPAMSRAWDKFANKHEQAYNDQLEASTTASGVAAMGARIKTMAEDGIPFNGTTVQLGDPLWPQLAGFELTKESDKQLQMIGGAARVRALKEMREQLIGSYGQVPKLSEALTFVRGGDPSVPMEKRPTWGASNPLDMLELKNRGNEARIKDYELGQQGIEQKLDALWFQQGSPGAMLPTDPGYPAALLAFRNQAAALGYRDFDNYINGRMSSTSSVLAEAYRPDPLASQDFLSSIEDTSPSVFASPEGLKQLRQQAREAARAEPTSALQAERYREYNEAIERKRRQAEEATPGVQQQISQSLLQDLALPEVKKKLDAGKAGGSSMMQSLIQQGADPASAAASAFGRSEAVAFTNGVQNLYLRAAEDALNQWREDNPGRAMSPAAKNRIVSQAVADARKSKAYEDLYSTLTGKKPGQVGPGSVGTGPGQGTQPGPQARGVPKAKAAALPDSTVKGYAARPVMEGNWLHSELDSLNKGKPVSAELYQLAKRAGTSVNRYLLEQLRFYPQLDPDGSASRYLQDQVRKQRQGQQVSSANYGGATGGLAMVPTAYNPMAPGSWLMNLLMPPAAAATLPPMGGGGRPFGGSGGSFERPASVVYERPDGQPGVDLYFPSKRFPAVLGGVVKDVSREGGYGNYIVVESIDPLTNRKVDVLYGHLADGSVRVRPGQRISAGDVIGQQGGTGNVRSADGTIASIDFLAPREAGSRDMTPYSGFDQLRRHVVSSLQGSASSRPATRSGGGLTGLATYYTGSGGSDGVAGGPTANGERYNPNAMTAAVQWSLRGKYLNKWVTVEDLDTGKTVKVWVNDVGQMGGSRLGVNRQDPRVIDLSPAAFKKLFGSTSRGVGRIRIVEG